MKNTIILLGVLLGALLISFNKEINNSIEKSVNITDNIKYEKSQNLSSVDRNTIIVMKRD
ncbi:hypothetical protein [Flavobacterium sp.]|jgi:hypothetical protein|uniref:hypothetical protein n=1 Tax=Flavobacterium sp. TaxID=239 RepID=UPI003D2A1C28